ncbi:glycoside hydrolase family 88 protein [Cohnella sp. REN36]|uniref:glycoside hydrolase family 88 protein n=1 Tax=Cohnella sp. REN36 TaxID=2887347 RepID=UPI001D155922|nr:glycoside hydrolase family 88 protein [Cohnella sp. REN36]MCC3374551.1 glycoside hydrolase family 88 protein [Cohnella sp. REN36]
MNLMNLKPGDLDDWWSGILRKTDRMLEAIGDASPHVSAAGVYDDVRLDWWTSGFWPGQLWLLHELTGSATYHEAAWPWDARIEQAFVRDNNFHHDVGFQFLPTAVVKHRLTGDEDACRRALAAAGFLAGRFNLNGRFLRAWNQDKIGWAIIDSMMNLSLLFWASERSGDPRYRQIACAHADTVLSRFLRPDGSVHHIVAFDPETGAVKAYLGGQGHAPFSSWSRGQAWALYGMANAYRYTGIHPYLHAAQRIAHYFVSCLPEDGVPHWDFRAPDLAAQPRDTSAAAIAASGLLEIARLADPEWGGIYQLAAERLLLALSSERYSALNDLVYQGLLKEGTGHKPAGSNVNVSLIYGDYFYMEAIAKLRGWTNRIF